MRCLLCGKDSEKIICSNCISKADKDLCYKVAKFDYYTTDNELWKELAEGLEKAYMFRDYSLELVDYIDEPCKEFVKINCMNLMNPNYLGVSKYNWKYVIEHGEYAINNENLNNEEKNYVRALMLGVYVSQKNWQELDSLVGLVELGKTYLEPYLILADYYSKIRNYEKALEILGKANEVFNDVKERQRIISYINDCKQRQSGEKKPWKPSKKDEIDQFYLYLDKLGVERDIQVNGGKKKKISIKNFKPFNYYDDKLPDDYVVLWFTTEFYLKAREVVEINAIRVEAGKEIDSYRSLVKPVNTPKKYEHVNPKQIENAKIIRDVFPDFLKYLRDDIIVFIDVENQKKYLSRLARYSMMDHLDNCIFDLVAYAEDIHDEIFTSDSLIKKYGMNDCKDGMEKVRMVEKIINKMRG